MVEKGLKVGQDIDFTETSAPDSPGHHQPQQLSVSRTGGVQICVNPLTKVVDVDMAGKAKHQASSIMPRQIDPWHSCGDVEFYLKGERRASPPWAVARGYSEPLSLSTPPPTSGSVANCTPSPVRLSRSRECIR